MKEVLFAGRNIRLAVEGDYMEPSVEAVITVTEPRYRADANGDIEQFREPETLRFATTPDGMRDIAEKMNKWADEADEAARKAAAGGLELPEKEPTDQ